MLQTLRDPVDSREPAVSVVVPVLDGGATFRGLLDDLTAQRVQGGHEIVVVDSDSRDASVDAAIAAGARVFRTPDFCHGRTRNEAIAVSRAPLIVLLTQDARPRGTRFLQTLVAPLRDDPRLAGAWARQVPAPAADPLVQATIRRWCPPGRDRRQRAFAEGEFELLAPMERAFRCRFDNVASCLRRAAWDHHPLPDVPFGEDTAWARRVLIAGHDLLYRAAAEVTHAHEPGLFGAFRRDRLAHELLAVEFGLTTVPSPVDAGIAWAAGFGSDLADLRAEGVGIQGLAQGLVRGSARRFGALAGQYVGGREGRRRGDRRSR